MSESIAPQRRRCVVTAKQIAVKKYVVELSDAERERLSALIPYGQAPGAAADEGAYPVESRHVEDRRGMERQPDRHGFGHQYGHGCPDPSATGRGMLRGGAYPQAFASLGEAANRRWRR